MTAENLPRFDIAALRRLAGSAFTRGEAYHRDGRVEILAIEPRRVLAQVAGTEDYRVNLLGKGETIKGECSCPAFDDYGFCKHMVAAALAANESDHGPEAGGAGALARIRAHLADKPNGVLVSDDRRACRARSGPVSQAGDRLGRRRRRRQDSRSASGQGDRPGDGHSRLH